MISRRQAWIVTGILVFCLLSWAVWAYHDAYVQDYRSKSASAAGCPFESTKKESECCSKNEEATKDSTTATTNDKTIKKDTGVKTIKKDTGDKTTKKDTANDKTIKATNEKTTKTTDEKTIKATNDKTVKKDTTSANDKTTKTNDKTTSDKIAFAKMANPDGDVESELSKFAGLTSDQLSKCPYHAKLLKAKKSEKK